MNTPKIITTVGVPGSGKSTAIRKMLAENPNAVLVNPDSIRKEVTGSESDLSQDVVVWKIAYERTEQAVAAGKDVIFDATFVSSKARARHHLNLKPALMYGAKIVYLHANTPLKVALERNAKRERKVPVHVIEGMWNSFTPPTINEHPDIESVGVLETA